MYECLEVCPDCGVQPGQRHNHGCDIEHCSVCGLQRINCDHEELHDRRFGRWTGIYPGEAECLALGFITEDGMPDLNRLYSTGLYKIFFIKP